VLLEAKRKEEKVERRKEMECAPEAVLQEHAIITTTSSLTSLTLAVPAA
jgi:hypothetical protein